MIVLSEFLHIEFLVSLVQAPHLFSFLIYKPVENSTKARLVHILVTHELTKVIGCLVSDI